MQKQADLFKALSDPTRLRLVVLMALHGEICVCVLADALGEPEYKISRHLRVLRSAGIVEGRRQGAWVYYRLAQPRSRLEGCLQECLRRCLQDHETVLADSARLKRGSCPAE